MSTTLPDETQSPIDTECSRVPSKMGTIGTPVEMRTPCFQTSTTDVEFEEADGEGLENDAVGEGLEKEAIGEGSETAGKDTDDEEDDNEPNRKKKLTSKVWKHFKRTKIGGIKKAICHYCQKIYGREKKSGTSHLLQHLQRCPKLNNNPLKKKLDNIMGSSLSPHVYDPDAARAELAKMIIMHGLPLSIPDFEYFRSFTQIIQPKFKQISRNTSRSDILKIYSTEIGKTQCLLEENTSRVALTIDMWTASNQNKGYMVLTSHFIDDNWTLQSRLLRFIQVPYPHTAEVLSDLMMESILEWNLYDKISCITVDNCSTNDAMIAKLLEGLDLSKLLLNGTLFHMRCAAHILNLIVKQGLTVIDDSIDRIRKSVSFWTGSPKREQKFEEMARTMKVKCSKKLSLDCKTRWNSTYLMLSTALIYKDVFFRLQREPNYRHLPDEGDWQFAKEVCEKLRVFFMVTEQFSGTSYPTANLFFGYVCKIKIALSKWTEDTNAVISLMAEQMLNKFSAYWDRIHGLMAVATVLDPRFKMMLVECYFPQVYNEEDSPKEIERIRNYCLDLVQEYSGKVNCQVSQRSPSSSNAQDSVCKDMIFHDFDEFVKKKSKRRRLVDRAKSELDRYLSEDVQPRTDDFDILGWWRLAKVKYPTLHLIARDLLAIPVSTVASESAFSTSGRWISKHRSKLSPEIIEALMCTRNWIWMDSKKATSSLDPLISVDEEEVDYESMDDQESSGLN